MPSLSNVSRAHLLPLTIMMLPMNIKLVSPSIQGKESSNQQSPSILGSIESLSDLACSSFVTWRRRIEPSRSWTLNNSEYDQRTLRKARRARSLEGKAMRNKLPGNILIHQSQLASQYKRRASKTSLYSTMSHNGSAIRQDPRHKSALNQKEKQKQTSY